MEKLKNFIYNTSDILIAILIILISITVISIKTTNILNYSQYLAKIEAQNPKNENFGLMLPVGEKKDGPKKSETETKPEKSTQTPERKPEIYAVYVNSGESLQSIADKFVGLGMFDSREEFIALAEEMQATTSLKYGNFQIPANATKKEVISLLVISP